MTGFASLIKGLDPKQDPPQELLDLLGDTLRSRMEQLDLWDTPPSVLGYGANRMRRHAAFVNG